MDSNVVLKSPSLSKESLKMAVEFLPIAILVFFLLFVFSLVQSARSFQKRPLRSALAPLFFLALRYFVVTNLHKVMEPLLNSASLPLNHRAGEAVPIADLHCDAMLWTSGGRSLLHTSLDPVRGTPIGMVDIPRLTAGGVSLQVFAAVLSSPRNLSFKKNRRPRWYEDLITIKAVLEWPMRTWGSEMQRALFQYRRLKQDAARSNGKLFIATDREQLRAQSSNFPPPVAAILAVEGLSLLESDVNNVNMLHAAGVRILGPTHFFDTEVGGSMSGECECGLSAFGARVIARTVELGMIVDLAHASPALIADITALPASARPPLLLSHTGVRAVCDHIRNYDDEALRAVADAGGLVGVTLFEPAMCGGDIVLSFVRSVRYVVHRFGLQCVALGSDWDGAIHTSVSSADAQVLAQALRSEGNFSESEVRQIMYGNVRAFFERHL